MTSDSGFSSRRSDRPDSRPLIALVAIILVGVIARLVWLDRLPGIDGDEARYGVSVHVFRDGGTPFWRTASGNLLNPFHSIPLYLLSFVMAPSGALLRMPEVIWGVLATVIAYPMFLRPLGPRAAVLVAVLLALNPTAIAYARFGWDPSGVPLVSLLAIGFALRGLVVAAALSTLAALIVHPTAIFLVPIVLSGFGPPLASRYTSLSEPAKRRWRNGAGGVVVVAIPLALWLLDALAKNPDTVVPSIEIVLGRVFSPTAWLDLATGVIRLFSGVSAISDMAGALSPWGRTTLDLIAVLVFIVPLALAVRRFRADRPSYGLWLLAGLVVSLIAFHVVSGPLALASGRERYGLFLLVPEIVLVAMALDRLADARPLLAGSAATLAAASFVALTVGGYFVPLISRGGEARPALRTGASEPKVAAFDFIISDSASAEVIQVMTEDWHLYWPLQYLAGPYPRFHVELLEGANAPRGLRPAGVAAPPYPHAPDVIYSLVFDNGGEWRRLRAAGETPAFTASDPLGRPILHVVRAPRSF